MIYLHLLLSVVVQFCVIPRVILQDFLVVTGTADTDTGKLYYVPLPNGPWDDRNIDFRFTLGKPHLVDFFSGHAYWTDSREGVIAKSSTGEYTGVEPLPLEAGYITPWQSPVGVAIDPVTSLIYYTDNGLRHIAVTPIDGHTKYILVPHTSVFVNDPKAIAIDYAEGYLFWVDHPYTIQRANMNGQDALTITTRPGSIITGIETDMNDKKIYWCDEEDETLEYADYTGLNAGIAVRFPTRTFCQDIAIDDYYIYVIQRNTVSSVVHVLLLFNKNSLEYSQRVVIGEVFPTGTLLFGLAVKNYNQNTAPSNCNPNNGACGDGFCIPTPSGRTCACNDNECSNGDSDTDPNTKTANNNNGDENNDDGEGGTNQEDGGEDSGSHRTASMKHTWITMIVLSIGVVQCGHYIDLW